MSVKKRSRSSTTPTSTELLSSTPPAEELENSFSPPKTPPRRKGESNTQYNGTMTLRSSASPAPIAATPCSSSTKKRSSSSPWRFVSASLFTCPGPLMRDVGWAPLNVSTDGTVATTTLEDDDDNKSHIEKTLFPRQRPPSRVVFIERRKGATPNNNMIRFDLMFCHCGHRGHHYRHCFFMYATTRDGYVGYHQIIIPSSNNNNNFTTMSDDIDMVICIDCVLKNVTLRSSGSICVSSSYSSDSVLSGAASRDLVFGVVLFEPGSSVAIVPQ
eukprot:PhM_4_TR7805/c1_g1_i1/m.3488